MSEKEEFLEPETVARILDLTPDEVIQLARSGELKATKMGRFWKYRRADVMAFKARKDLPKGSVFVHDEDP
jgi:excisionase family DNA binding protein